jgi:hypothetical protein
VRAVRRLANILWPFNDVMDASLPLEISMRMSAFSIVAVMPAIASSAGPLHSKSHGQRGSWTRAVPATPL